MSDKRTITLTNRPPVAVCEDAWPIIATARDREFDGQYDFQANQISKWFMGVRQHEDGRAIVYATYSYESRWAGSRDYSAKHGELLPAGASAADIVTAIRAVAERMTCAESHAEDSERWSAVMNECIADLPAEILE